MAMTKSARPAKIRIGYGLDDETRVWWSAYACTEAGETMGNLNDQGTVASRETARRHYEHLLQEFRGDSRFEVVDEGLAPEVTR
jgi:hypothetical protein